MLSNMCRSGRDDYRRDAVTMLKQCTRCTPESSQDVLNCCGCGALVSLRMPHYTSEDERDAYHPSCAAIAAMAAEKAAEEEP